MVSVCVRHFHMICSENTSLCQNVLFIFISPLSGRLISLGDAASFVRVCLSLCFQLCIKIPGSAGYHGVSSLLSAHSNPADFSTWFFISVFLSICLLFFSLFFILYPTILIPSPQEKINPTYIMSSKGFRSSFALLLQSQREDP